MQTQSKVFPGMLNQSTEFFNSDNGLMFIQNGFVKPFCDLPFTTIEYFKELLNLEDATRIILNEWFPDQKMKQIEKLISCRFGGLDFVPDFENGKMQDGEYWECPMLGNCKGEGVVCKSPCINGHKLSAQEIKIIQLSTTELTNDVIADKLNMPMGSFNKLKHQVYQLIDAVTKQKVTQFAYQNNFI